jgi:hypothetical protein
MEVVRSRGADRAPGRVCVRSERMVLVLLVCCGREGVHEIVVARLQSGRWSASALHEGRSYTTSGKVEARRERDSGEHSLLLQQNI